MRLIRETNYDFMSKRKWAFLFSLAIIIPGLISMIARGGLNLGVDFTGGTQVEIQLVPKSGTSPDVPIEKAREAVATAGYDSRNIQRAGGGEANDFLIHIQTSGEEAGAAKGGAGRHVSELIMQELQKQFPDYRVDLRQVQSIGPKVGNELKSAAIQAVLASILLVLIYVAFRFEFRFGVATIVAATHDVLFVLGLFSLLNEEMTLTVIAAFLTLVGYSVNDTIVVFDRIREELKIKQKRESYNRSSTVPSTNAVRGRLLTGDDAARAAFAVLRGREVIHDFSWVLLVGIVVEPTLPSSCRARWSSSGRTRGGARSRKVTRTPQAAPAAPLTRGPWSRRAPALEPEARRRTHVAQCIGRAFGSQRERRALLDFAGRSSSCGRRAVLS